MRRSGKDKVLRACVVQGGNVIEERILPRRAALSIGTGAKNTFVVASVALPKSHELVVARGGGYELCLGASMSGKIASAQDPDPIDLATLRSQALLKRRGKSFVLPLNFGHRGTVIAGDVTVAFEFVDPPPPAPRMVLPREFRKGILGRIDLKFAASLLVVLAFEAPIIFKVAAHPMERKQVTLENLDTRFAQLIVPERKLVETKVASETEKTAKTAAPKTKRVSTESNQDPAARARAKVERAAQIRKNIAGKGVLAVLGAEGEGPASAAVANVLSQGGITGELDEAFEGISGVGLASSSAERSTRGGGSGKAASIGGLATAGGGAVAIGAKREEKVGSVQAEAPEVDGALDSDAVARVVRARMRMVEDCYQRELKRNPKLAGKIEIEFTIGADGTVTQARIASNRMGVDDVAVCVVSRIQRWKFPKPSGGSVTVTFPFIFTPSE